VQYTLATSEWFNVIHDILQDINRDVVPGICTRPKKVIVATLSNGTMYVDKFLAETSLLPINSSVVEAWDFDTDIVSGQEAPLDPHNRRLRAYWQGRAQIRPNTKPSTYIHLPPQGPNSWQKLDALQPLQTEVPPLPTMTDGERVHHYIRDMMFLDADFNIEADNS
jgi:hypothetical protein